MHHLNQRGTERELKKILSHGEHEETQCLLHSIIDRTLQCRTNPPKWTLVPTGGEEEIGGGRTRKQALQEPERSVNVIKVVVSQVGPGKENVDNM